MFARPFRKHGKRLHYHILNVGKWWYTNAGKLLDPIFCIILYNLSNYSQFTGPVPLSTYMRIYKKGDIVDIKVSALGSL